MNDDGVVTKILEEEGKDPAHKNLCICIRGIKHGLANDIASLTTEHENHKVTCQKRFDEICTKLDQNKPDIVADAVVRKLNGGVKKAAKEVQDEERAKVILRGPLGISITTGSLAALEKVGKWLFAALAFWVLAHGQAKIKAEIPSDVQHEQAR
jgi:hypothetical protein